MHGPTSLKSRVLRAIRNDPRSLPRKLWDRLFTYQLHAGKLSTRNLIRLCRENATDRPTLVVHSEDVDFSTHFPNRYIVSKRSQLEADLWVDEDYVEVASIPDDSYDVILCTGLLEHVTDPQRLIDDFHRILRPGGRLIMSASAVFSFHEGPTNYFHFTPHGMHVLLREWSDVQVSGASQPFETIGILIQRISLQSRINPLAKPLVAVLAWSIRFLDVFVGRQYDSRRMLPEREIDSMLPSNVQIVATASETV